MTGGVSGLNQLQMRYSRAHFSIVQTDLSDIGNGFHNEVICSQRRQEMESYYL